MDEAPTQSIVELIAELVRIPTRAGRDDYAPLFTRLHDWLELHDVPHRFLYDDNAAVGLLIDIGAPSERVYLLNATIDTVGFGNEENWSGSPTSGDVRGGWLHGRGAADSKAGVAIFSHIATAILASQTRLRHRLHVLFDADEHTGKFGGLRADLSDHAQIAGAMLGYPGFDAIGIGSRGFERALLTIHGVAAHSGSGSNAGINAIARAARLITTLSRTRLPNSAGQFPLPPSPFRRLSPPHDPAQHPRHRHQPRQRQGDRREARRP